MNASTRTLLATLADQMCSGFAPKGEACFDAGKLIKNVLAEPQLFGVTIDRADGGGTEFVAVLANSEDEARDLAVSTVGDGNVELVEDLAETLIDQYGGVAILSTGDF